MGPVLISPLAVHFSVVSLNVSFKRKHLLILTGCPDEDNQFSQCMYCHVGPIRQMVVYRIEGRALCRSFQFIPMKLSPHVFMDLAFCTGTESCWDRKGPFPKLFPQSWERAIV